MSRNEYFISLSVFIKLIQIPSLESNYFVEKFEDLYHRMEESFLPLAMLPPNVQFIPALEMLDATQIPHIPRHLATSSTITVGNTV